MRTHLVILATFALGTLLGTATLAQANGTPASASKPKKMNTMTPRFSHDGTKMSYEFHVPKTKQKGVHICASDGKGCKAVEPDTGASAAGFDDGAAIPVRELAWHPKGRSYVYGSTGGRSTLNIFMEGEGCLTCDKTFGFGNKIHSTWSPDGKYLAFAVEDPQTEHGEIYLVDIFELEKGPTKLTSHDDDTSYQPRFSPNGKSLLFTRFNPEKSDNDLYVLDDFTKPKSGVRKLTNQTGAELNGSWSPDGTKVAYYSVYLKGKKTLTDLYVINADGTGKTLLHKGVVKPDLSNPVWSADGTKIVFVRDNAKDHNPIASVSVADPKSVKNLPTGTEQNSDVAGFPAGQGSIRLLWTSQGKKSDKEKTWRRVFTGTYPLQ